MTKNEIIDFALKSETTTAETLWKIYQLGVADGYSNALDVTLEKLNKHSEYVRPVGWNVKQEIILMSTARDIIEQLKRGGENE